MKRLIALAGLLIIIGAALYERPIPAVQAIASAPALPATAQPISLPWPAAGQAALGAKGYGLLARNGADTPVPIASTAKVITALAVLQKKPITPAASSPVITLTQSDVDLFNKYFLNDGSVAQVQAGEQISEYQALEAMLLPSANNMADTMAIWAFGSIDNYTAYANQMVKSMGMNSTTVGDATGFSDTTFSTAADMVKLALAAMDNPTIAAIAKEPSASLPVGGPVENLNWLLGQDGVIGIKTGNTDKAGGCYLFAAARQVLGHQVLLTGAILGDTNLTDAIRQADTLIKSSDGGFTQITAIHKDQVLGSYKAPWDAKTDIKAARDISLLIWKGETIKTTYSEPPIKAPARAGSSVGTVTAAAAGQQSAASNLVLADNLPSPSWTWRIFHR